MVLLPTLSNFLQAETVDWFKSATSGHLARIPLRPGGVGQTIMFIASQIGPSLGKEVKEGPSNGPIFTVKAIMQISRLLASVPQDMDAVEYFTIIGPQLLALLDGDDPDLRRTASYAIGNGILGKRDFGAPGKIGHLIFVEPIYGALTGELADSSLRWLRHFSDSGESEPLELGEPESSDILVDSSFVDLAIERLTSLVLQHPNPGLLKRIVGRILLPLWNIAAFTQDQQLTKLHEKVFALLQAFFTISVGQEPFKKLVDNLLRDGGPNWTFKVEGRGRDHMSLVRRHVQPNDQSNIIKLIDSLQSRTEMFFKLLQSDPNTEDIIGQIFLYVSQRWLVQSSSSGTNEEITDATYNIMQKLVSAKVAEKLLENFKETLSRRPLRILELIEQIIEGERRSLDKKREESRLKKTGAPSLSALGSIVSETNSNTGDLPETESSESLSTAFSLLSTVLASPEFASTQETKQSLESIKANLDQLIPLLPNALQKPATTSSMLLEIQLTSPEHDDDKAPPPHISDLETHRQALANLNSELPPVQAEGFSLLSKLVMNSSPVLDIPSTLTLLLSIISDVSESTANEEFIYLNAIKLIGTLGSRHPRTVTKTLVDSYTDKSEQRSLDQRLKIGEAILRTVQDLGTALAGETAKILGEGMVTVAGRRGRKPQAQKLRKQQQEKERRQQEREDRKRNASNTPGWSISTGPSDTEPAIDLGDDDSDTETPEQTAHAANIIEAWAAGASSDEEPDDLRVRASALSILASAVQTNIIGLGHVIVAAAVDLALSTLSLEQAPESAILRRASVVLVLDILKALDTAREERNGQDVGFGFSLANDGLGGSATIGHIPTMLQTLGVVESKETDSIVRGHLRALIESLEAWLENTLLGGIGSRHGYDGVDDIKLELGNRIQGLDLDPMAGRDGSSRPRIEEIE